MLVVYVQLCRYVLLYIIMTMKLITSSTDLANIMNTGNELYTALSSLWRQITYLMLRELPAEVIAFNTTLQIQYSSRYTDNVHGSFTIDLGCSAGVFNIEPSLSLLNYPGPLVAIYSFLQNSSGWQPKNSGEDDA